MKNLKDLENTIKDLLSKAVASGDAAAIDELHAFLSKARRRTSDEQPMFDDEDRPYSTDDDDESDDEFSEKHGYREFDPDQEEDDADRWLSENDPERKRDDEDEAEGDEPSEEDDYYDEYGPDEDDQEADHQGQEHLGEFEPEAEDDVEQPEAEQQGGTDEGVPQAPQAKTQVAPSSKPEEKEEGRFPQPSKEEIADMRQYTRPWEQRARDTIRLRAEAHKNPVLYHQGRLVEASRAASQDRDEAHKAFQASPEYQNADFITQMEMDAKFDQDWHKNNPDWMKNALKASRDAHEKGRQAKDIHAAAKHDQIQHILSGGMHPTTGMSTEEALQHAGGSKDDEGTTGTISQDRAASYAAANQDFIKQYADEYAKKAKKPKSMEDMSYDNAASTDIARVLGNAEAMKDPARKAKVDAFFNKYHPLISMSARKVLNKLGIDQNRGDVDLGMLHEAGMHGLFHAINDYDHDHPSKASFATHAGNKIRGLMQTALKNQDQIPDAVKVAQRNYQRQSAPSTQPQKKGVHDIIANHPPERMDRLKRIQTFKGTGSGGNKPEGENQ